MSGWRRKRRLTRLLHVRVLRIRVAGFNRPTQSTRRSRGTENRTPRHGLESVANTQRSGRRATKVKSTGGSRRAKTPQFKRRGLFHTECKTTHLGRPNPSDMGDVSRLGAWHGPCPVHSMEARSPLHGAVLCLSLFNHKSSSVIRRPSTGATTDDSVTSKPDGCPVGPTTGQWGSFGVPVKTQGEIRASIREGIVSLEQEYMDPKDYSRPPKQ